MAFGRGADDREPEAGAGLAAGAAPEACEGPLRLLRYEPRAFVGDGQAGNPVLLLGADRDPAAFRPVELGVPDDVREQRRQRSSQLVRCVSEEATLVVAGPLEARQHLVQRRRERPDLVAGSGLREAAARIAGTLDVRRRLRQLSERP